jgi:S-adenosylmethionine:tRNA ribosyltransferase-isomerase
VKTSDFSFNLPEELIAQEPSERRGGSRLLVYRRSDGSITHSSVANLPQFIPADALMVLNDTRVRKARVYGRTEGGSQVEFLFLQPLDARGNPLAQDLPSDTWRVLVSKAKKQKPGRRYTFPGDLTGEIVAIDGQLRIIRMDRAIGEGDFSAIGHVPLPPYIRREDRVADESRYQTVYADKPGSVAAPTAGLHITDDIMNEIDRRGILRRSVTLHVGLGTFLPVRSEHIEDHRMHREEYEISESTAEAVTNHKRDGKPVLAVGTTSVRTLESAWDGSSGRLTAGRASTDIFMYPGYSFSVVDHLMTNFHTPESTLLMLVSAFAGRDEILRVYEAAVKERYRFFSYGDAMLIL